jgi:hypothetical protein
MIFYYKQTTCILIQLNKTEETSILSQYLVILGGMEGPFPGHLH